MRSWIVATLVMTSAVLAGSVLAASPDRSDVATMAPAEITALQRRLTDAGCYTGPVDGQPSDATTAAVAACPDQRPQLRIETGMHVSAIQRIGVDAGCTIAATASYDKTVRLWSLPDGALLRTLRGPIGAGNAGKVFAIAVSPDGRFVAAGGWDARFETFGTHAVTITETASGAVVARVGDFEDVILNLTFSPDGAFLAAGLGGGKGVRMIETAGWRQVAADKAYGSYSLGTTFGPDGRLYTVAYDGKLRRYARGPGFALEQSIATRGGKQPYSVAIDGGGTLLAVGYTDTTVVDLYDANTLASIGKADTKGIDNGDLSKVAWRPDGQVLLAGGGYLEANGKHPVLLFDRVGRRLRQQTPAKAENTILNLQPCGAGFALAAADPAFGLLDPSGRARVWRAGVAPDMRDKLGDAFTIAADAKSVRFGLDDRAKRPVVFDVLRANLSDSAGTPAGFYPPTIQGLPIADWMHQFAPRFGAMPIKLKDYERSRSLAIGPDRSGFVLGTEYNLRAYDAAGRERWAKAGPNIAWGVNLSADGRIVVAAYGDGTIRWHRWSDGQELLALFVNKETKAWVAWTPSGYYSASAGGEDMIGWHVNRGWAQAADFFPASRFRDTYARPDIVEKVLDTLDEGEAIKAANAARGGRTRASEPIIDRLPPVLSILAPLEGARVGDEVRVDYIVRSPSGLPVDAVEVLIDGRPAPAGRGLARLAEGDALKTCLVDTHGAGRVEGALQGCRGTLTVTLPPGSSSLGLVARSGERASEVAAVRVTRGSAPSADERLKPKLYALVVGISAYGNRDYALVYPAKDARDFAAALENQKGGLYADVSVKLLPDDKATAIAIKDGLDWLTKQVTSRDVGMVYLAGHGVLDERDRFYFLAADSDAARIRATGVAREDISDALDSLPGKAMLFLDACHSGAIAGPGRRGVDINGVVNDFTRGERGVVAFTASTGRQASQESDTWNNGVFTKALVEGLGSAGRRGKADLRGDGKITTSELDAYVTERVKSLTGGTQSPIMIRPPTVPDFPMAVAR